MAEFFGQSLVLVLLLIGAALVLTIYVFRRRRFDRGYREGEAASPREVKRQNPPDRWRKSR
jgi:hypothetical protein